MEVAVLGSPPNEPYGFRGRKATLNHAQALVSLSLICQPTSEDMKFYIITVRRGSSQALKNRHCKVLFDTVLSLKNPTQYWPLVEEPYTILAGY